MQSNCAGGKVHICVAQVRVPGLTVCVCDVCASAVPPPTVIPTALLFSSPFCVHPFHLGSPSLPGTNLH